MRTTNSGRTSECLEPKSVIGGVRIRREGGRSDPSDHFDLPLLAMGRLDQPLLAIIGTADPTVPPAEALALFGAAAGPKQILVVPGSGHTQAYFAAPQLYLQTVLGFLARSLVQTQS